MSILFLFSIVKTFFFPPNLSRNTWSMAGNRFDAWKDRVREIYGTQRTDGLSSVPVRPFSTEYSITFLYWWTDPVAEGAIFYTENLTRLSRDRADGGGGGGGVSHRNRKTSNGSTCSPSPAATPERVFPFNNKSCPIYLTVKIVRLYRTILLLFKAQYHKSTMLMCINSTVNGPFARVF